MGMPIIKPSEITREQAITDIIESIALMEAALSHILNAEGEKIQSVVGTLTPSNPNVIASSPTDLININSSVQKMVNTITMLELVLQNKLSSVHCSCE
ncbi:MAG: hypothetical protein ACRDDY_16540 [Clostridium sp.]|uniref:hypothetical protein n=1 Tax=Clostridium sp. TaxID=1506 RepID=UPI003EE7915A